MKIKKSKPFIQRVGRATSRGILNAGGAVGSVLFLFGKGLMRGIQDVSSELEKEKNNER